MIKEAINRILELGGAKLYWPLGENEDSVAFSDKELAPITPPTPKALTVHTLGSLEDIINHDQLPVNKIAAQIVSPRQVWLIGQITNPYMIRHVYAVATVPRPAPALLGQWMEYEKLVLFLQTGFVQDEETARLMKIVGNITAEQAKTLADDGVTQKVTIRTGVARVGETEVVNPFNLRPYRIFPEVEQPVSPFILRLEQNRAGLFEADNGAWEVEAIRTIAEYFANMKIPVIA